MRRLTAVLLVAVAVAGCKKSEAPAPAAPPPAGSPTADAGAGTTLTGTVTERLAAQTYTYLKLKTDKGEVWTAVPETDTKVGAQVSVVNAMPMNGFESKTLNRKFDVVYFGTLGGQGGAGPAPTPGPETANVPGVAAAHAKVAQADVGDVKTEKAKGADARTVAEVYAQKDALKDKPVSVRGKVVKYNPGIMGKNWVHVRDGSGKDGTNDLTVATQDNTAVGDVVTVKGTVKVGKDYGAGYYYVVIVEDATITK